MADAEPPNPENATLEQICAAVYPDSRKALCERVKLGAWVGIIPAGLFRELEQWGLIDDSKVPTPRGLALATYQYIHDASLGSGPNHCSPFPRRPVDPSIDEVVDAVHNSTDPTRRAEVDAYLKSLMDLTWRVIQAMQRLPPHLDRHYRGEVTAIAKDLVRDLGLGDMSDEQSQQALLVFLQRGNDDGDGDSIPVPVPEPGETVPV